MNREGNNSFMENSASSNVEGLENQPGKKKEYL